jgi:hypothetical protein
LTLNFSNPIYALDITTNGIRATSYSNGNYITSIATFSKPIKTYISKSNIIILNNDFISSYTQAI